MSGFPGFQANAFQSDAFQAGVSLVAGDYSLGSPVFATPAAVIKRNLSAATYSLGSPVFATPTLVSSSGLRALNANPYSLGALAFTAPFLRQVNALPAPPAYALGPPAFATPSINQNRHLIANVMSLGALAWSPAILQRHQALTVAASYSLGPLAIGPAGISSIDYHFAVDAYSLGSPSFGYPRLQWQLVTLDLPPTYFTQAEEAADMLKMLLNHLMMSIPPVINEFTNDARRQIDVLRSNAEAAVRAADGSLGTQLYRIYVALDAAGASYAGVEMARQYLMSHVASKSVHTQVIYRNALLMNLALESVLITRMKFETREQAHNMVLHVRDMFDAARAQGIDEVDALLYRSITSLGGQLTHHLASTSLELPRLVEFTTQVPMPSLYLANRIYGDAERADEIAKENGVIHPAFCPTQLRVLSNVRR